MPVLHEKKTGGYYIVGSLWGSGWCTWQLDLQGFWFLARLGISVGDEVPARVLQDLVHRDLARTGGSGLGARHEVDVVHAKKGIELFLEEGPLDWHLVLWFPEAPSDCLDGVGVDNILDQLSECHVAVDQYIPLPAIHLLPGQGGIRYCVQPQEERYVTRVLGDWLLALTLLVGEAPELHGGDGTLAIGIGLNAAG